MNYRTLGKTGFKISEVSLGTWQVGGTWGSGFDHKLASKLLHQAHEQGVNFIGVDAPFELTISDTLRWRERFRGLACPVP